MIYKQLSTYIASNKHVQGYAFFFSQLDWQPMLIISGLYALKYEKGSLACLY